MNLDIMMYIPGLPFNGDTIKKESLGGSETAGYYMAREIAKRGHRVTVFSNTDQPGLFDKVRYLPISEYWKFTRSIKFDVAIVQRAPEVCSAKNSAKINILWCHDLALKRQIETFRGALWNIDKVMVVSEWMRDQYKSVYDLPEETFWVTRNGIDLSLFSPQQRDCKQLVYSSRPERGLDMLLQHIFPEILKRVPDAKLNIAGYINPVDHLQGFYQNIERLVSSFGSSVVVRGALSKQDLYKLYGSAGLCVYPTPSPAMPAFHEVSCITAMEAQAAGLPIITSKRGALAETIAPDAGHLIEGDPWSPQYIDEFVNASVKLMTDSEAWNKRSNAGLARASTLDWSGVAQEWEEGFIKQFEGKTRNKHTLALNFIRRSDIIAAKEAVKDFDDELALEIKDAISTHYGFIETPDKFKAQYEHIADSHTPAVFESAQQEPRLANLIKFLDLNPTINRVLDFGCAHGSYAINAANAAGREWVGVDCSQKCIDLANVFRLQHAKKPDNIKFIRGDADVDLSEEKLFDCLLLQEVLEHVEKPWDLINKLERWVKPGGKIYITVPFGPWEYDSYSTNPYRMHLWEFDIHDVHDMLSAKPGLQISTAVFGESTKLGEPLGWQIIEYVASPYPAQPIKLGRKLLLQAPRQTVSASIIAGPNSEDTLHWCLKSLKDIADEVVIMNCGMTGEGIRIAKEYGARIFEGVDPKTNGFETPRNMGIDKCRMDWILWIDTDEKLVDPVYMQKYFRDNPYQGYSVQQHHFACDANFPPDLPVRFFRNNGKLRFFGMIHEHPEMELNKGPGETIVVTDTKIAHVGYLSENIRRQRFMRNYPGMQADIDRYPDRLLQKHFIMRDNMQMVNFEYQSNGGQISEAMLLRCEQTIDLFRKYFLGKPGHLNADSLQYYSAACALLGIGFEVEFSVSADKEKVAGRAPIRARFANTEDYLAELNARAKQSASKFEETYW